MGVGFDNQGELSTDVGNVFDINGNPFQTSFDKCGDTKDAFDKHGKTIFDKSGSFRQTWEVAMYKAFSTNVHVP